MTSSFLMFGGFDTFELRNEKTCKKYLTMVKKIYIIIK